MEIHIAPEKVQLPILNIQVNQTVIHFWIVMAIILIFCLIFRFILIKRFKEVPGPMQNVIELCVESIKSYTSGNLGSKAGGMAAFSFTIVVAIVCSSLLELFGMRSPATDLNFPIAMALMSFALIVGYGIRYRGPVGYIKSFGQPTVIIWPIRFLSELIIPVSLSFRLFGNMFAAFVVMELIYMAMRGFAILVPAVFSIYFVLFDAAIQAYIFITLTQIFVHEAIEKTEYEIEKEQKKLGKKQQRKQRREEKKSGRNAA